MLHVAQDSTTLGAMMNNRNMLKRVVLADLAEVHDVPLETLEAEFRGMYPFDWANHPDSIGMSTLQLTIQLICVQYWQVHLGYSDRANSRNFILHLPGPVQVVGCTLREKRSARFMGKAPLFCHMC